MPVHRHFFRPLHLQVLMNRSLIRLADQQISRLLGLQLALMLARAADASADTDHAFHEIIRKLANLKKHQRLFALRSSIALHNIDFGIFACFLQTF